MPCTRLYHVWEEHGGAVDELGGLVHLGNGQDGCTGWGWQSAEGRAAMLPALTGHTPKRSTAHAGCCVICNTVQGCHAGTHLCDEAALHEVAHPLWGLLPIRQRQLDLQPKWKQHVCSGAGSGVRRARWRILKAEARGRRKGPSRCYLNQTRPAWQITCCTSYPPPACGPTPPAPIHPHRHPTPPLLTRPHPPPGRRGGSA